MKTIGILGGMSASSTQLYYKELCNLTRDQLGGLNSPQLLIRSLNFAEIEPLQMSGDWDTAGDLMNKEAKALQRGGADMLLLATNTMHKLGDAMMRDVDIPLLHIADATAAEIKSRGLERPGLLATAFTMEEDFYTSKLSQAGLEPLIPNSVDRQTLQTVIYDELCQDIILEKSREAFKDITRRLGEAGADCVILGCTEIGLLLNAETVSLPVFDTTLIHCKAAIQAAIS